jgi:predicted ester cyclase
MMSFLVLAIASLLAAMPATSLAAETTRAKTTARIETMSLDKQKRLSRRSLEMWASNSTDRPDEVFAANYVNHQEPDAKGGVKTVDLAGWKKIVAENRRAFSDFQVRVLMQVAEGDLVATRWQFSATQTGEYLGHPPTGRRATWTGVQIDRFENGRIAESWVDWDKYRLFEALGFLK